MKGRFDNEAVQGIKGAGKRERGSIREGVIERGRDGGAGKGNGSGMGSLVEVEIKVEIVVEETSRERGSRPFLQAY